MVQINEKTQRGVRFSMKHTQAATIKHIINAKNIEEINLKNNRYQTYCTFIHIARANVF